MATAYEGEANVGESTFSGGGGATWVAVLRGGDGSVFPE